MNQTYEKVPDNMESDFPARMSDGRQFTDYRQNCLLNNNIAQGKMSWEYRYYLERNADEIHNMFLDKDKEDEEIELSTNKFLENIEKWFCKKDDKFDIAIIIYSFFYINLYYHIDKHINFHHSYSYIIIGKKNMKKERSN